MLNNLVKNAIKLKTKNITRLSSSVQAAALKDYDDLPGPRPLPVVGNLFELKGLGGEFDILNYRDFQNHLQQKYGDIVKWNLFGKKECFIYDPKEIKKVFKNDGNMPLRPTLDPMVKVMEEIGISASLVNSQGERWRRLRSAVNPLMARPLTVHSYLPSHNQIGDDFIRLLNKKFENDSQSVVLDNFEEKLRLLALEFISEVVFDKRINCMDQTNSEAIEFVNSVNNFTVYAGRLLFQLPFWKIYATEDWKIFVKSTKCAYDEARKYIGQAQEKFLKAKANNEEVKASVLSQFLESQETKKINMDDIVAIMTDLLLGGVDTTSTSLHYFLYEMGKNLDVQEQLHQEIKTVLKLNEQITEDHIAQLKYLKYSVKENLRINSIAPSNARILHEDLVIQSYLIPKGTVINFGTAFITKSERFFKNPLKFDPNRWEREEAGTELIDPYSNLSFGFGARMCIGRRVAEQEMYLTIAKIFHHFKVEYIGNVPKVKIGLIATPDIPLKIKLTKRIQ